MKKDKTSALNYLLKNFFGVAIFTVIPSLMLSFYNFDVKLADFLIAEFGGNISADDYMFKLIDTIWIPTFDYSFVIMACGVLVTVVAFSLLLPKISRHMHLGVCTNKGILHYALSMFFKVALFVGVFILLGVLFSLCSIGLMYFVNMLNTHIWRGAILIVLSVMFNVLLAYLIAMFGLTLPVIVEEGYKINIAASYSTRLMSASANRKFVLHYIAWYILSRTAVLVLCLLVNIWYIRFLFVFVFYFVWMSLLVPMFCSKYVLSTQGERKDISKSVFRQS